jgi:hypothetical protein
VGELPADRPEHALVLGLRRPDRSRQQLDHSEHAARARDRDRRRAPEPGLGGDARAREVGVVADVADPARLRSGPDPARQAGAGHEREAFVHPPELDQGGVIAAPRRAAAQQGELVVRHPEQRDVPPQPLRQSAKDVMRRLADGPGLGEQAHDLRFRFEEPRLTRRLGHRARA